MNKDLHAEISALRVTADAAIASPLLPRSASDAIGQACKVIELLATDVIDMRADLARHFHARLPVTDHEPLGPV